MTGQGHGVSLYTECNMAGLEKTLMYTGIAEYTMIEYTPLPVE